jgi:argininosuccinate lyase
VLVYPVYRSRTEKSIDQDILDFLSSMYADSQVFYYDIMGTQAHVIMLHEIGYMPKGDLEDILLALEEAKEHRETIMKKREYEDVHESIEAFVIETIGMNKGGMLQTARSRNDQVMADLKMKVRDDINDINFLLANLIESMLRKADANTNTVMVLYTHLQHAQIGTFSHYLLSYTETLFRDMERLGHSYSRINQSPLGSSAVGGSMISIDRNRTAALLGFDQLNANSIDATSSRDVILEYLSCLSILMITLSRIAEDLILWSTSEFEYIEMADPASSTSSAMPQKKNPDPLEVLRSKSAGILGNLTASFAILKGLSSGYSRDLQELKNIVIGSSATTELSLRIMKYVIESCIVHKSRMLDVATQSFANAVDVAEFLASREHFNFRSAHRIVGSLVNLSFKNGKRTLNDLKEEEIEQILDSFGNQITAERLKNIIKACSVTRSLSLRTSKGSPNYAEQLDMISNNEARLRVFRERTKKRMMAIEKSRTNLSDIVHSYIISET